MANETRTLTGAIALIEVATPQGNKTVGKMRNVRLQESFRRVSVKGIGTIFSVEEAVVDFNATLSCDFMFVSADISTLPGVLNRTVSNIISQIDNGAVSLEDQLVLDSDTGVSLKIFKKIEDVIDAATGLIVPKKKPIALINNLLIESDNLDVSEGAISGRNQTFKYLLPYTIPQ